MVAEGSHYLEKLGSSLEISDNDEIFADNFNWVRISEMKELQAVHFTVPTN